MSNDHVQNILDRLCLVEQAVRTLQQHLATSEQGYAVDPVPDAPIDLPAAMRPKVIVSPAFDEEFYKLCGYLSAAKATRQHLVDITVLDPLLEAFERIRPPSRPVLSDTVKQMLAQLQAALSTRMEESVRMFAQRLVDQLLQEGTLA